MKKKLSPKLKKFLDFINQFTLIHDQSPSYEEIMQNLGFGSLGTVNWYVRTLEDQGHLHRVKGPMICYHRSSRIALLNSLLLLWTDC